MTAGELRERVTLQAAVAALSALGEPTKSFVDLVSLLPAKVEPLGGGETTFVGQQRTDFTYKVTIRYYSGLTTKHRFFWDSKTLEIDSISNPDGRRVWHECLCRGRS